MMQFDERFALGLVLNRNRSSNEKIKGGLQAQQFQKDSPVGIILMKEQVDRIESLEGQVASLTAERDALKKGQGAGPASGGSPGTPPPGGGGDGDQPGDRPRSGGDAPVMVDRGGMQILSLAAAEAFDRAREAVSAPTLNNHSGGNQSADQKHKAYAEEYQKNLATIMDQMKSELLAALTGGQGPGQSPAQAWGKAGP